MYEMDAHVEYARPVGSGKTALMLSLCQRLRDHYSIAAVTNDIFTKEDTEFLVRNKALPEERVKAIETGGCPHAVSRVSDVVEHAYLISRVCIWCVLPIFIL